MYHTIFAQDVHHGDVVFAPNDQCNDFEIKNVRETAAGCLVRVEGPRLDGTGKESLNFQPATLIEVSRI